jgi:Chaperone of endosialidase/Secretion system C-terminal sorting domain
MKKTTHYVVMGIICLLSSPLLRAQAVQTKAPTVLNVLPAASVDALRVSNGLISHLQAGAVGAFGAADQWIGIGSPLASNVLYGDRIQWNGQAFNKALRSQNPLLPAATKDAIIEWGNLGGEMQFRYITNPLLSTGFIKIHTLTSAGNAYYGAAAPPVFLNTPKVGISTSNQVGLNSTSSNTSSTYNVEVRTTSTAAGILGLGTYAFTNSTSTNNTNYGVLGYALGTGTGTRNFGVYGIASGLSTGINYGVYGNAPVGANSWAGYFQGNVFSTGLYIGSDAQIKLNVNTETNVLPNIMRVRPVTFNYDVAQYKELNLSPEKQHGFIAQELAVIFPEVVKSSRYSIPNSEGIEGSSKTFLSVNYPGLISILFRGIQEQQAQIEALRQTVIAANTVPTTPETGRGGQDRQVVTSSGTFDVSKFSLAQNTPNPFSSSTTIRYSIPDGMRNGVIAVFDLTGKMMMQFNGLSGRSQVTIDGNSLQAGMYIYTLLAEGQEVISKKMILTR